MSWVAGGEHRTAIAFTHDRPLDRNHPGPPLTGPGVLPKSRPGDMPKLKGAAPFESVEENVTGFVSDISEGRHWEESEAQRKERLRRDYHCLFNALDRRELRSIGLDCGLLRLHLLYVRVGDRKQLLEPCHLLLELSRLLGRP